MASLDRPSYMDFDFSRYFGSLVRLQLDLRLRAVYLELFLKIGESGGAVPNKPAVLATFIGGGCTATDIEQVLNVAEGLFEVNSDGMISHRVVTEKLSEIRDRREAAVRAGKASGQARGGKRPPKDNEHRSNTVPDSFNGSLNQEGLSEGLSDRERDLRAGAREQVKPIAQRAPDQNPRSTPRWTPPTTPPASARPQPPTPAQPGPLTPERMEMLLGGCLSRGPNDRDLQRPWLGKAFGAWFNRQRLPDQIQFEDAFTARFGFGIDTGPQGHRTPTGPTNGTGDGGDRPTGAAARNGEGIHNEPTSPVHEPVEEFGGQP